MANDVIKIGDYIVIQKQNYRKLQKLNKSNSVITVGRDSINLSGIEDCPYFSVFRMIPNDNKRRREYRLELSHETVELRDEIDIKTSGSDNRNIIDDGRSQKLSHAEIEELANDANKASDIVETLISNSKTFHNKTEFSQEKYLKKKEKKYFEFLQVLRPNLRIVAEVLYKLDPGKIQHLRIDALSQIITLSNVQSEGNHLLYDSGSNGLVAAALLSAIGENTSGKLIHMHPGNMSQKQALLAMNFSQKQYNRCISVNIYSVLRQIYQGNSNNVKDADSVEETNTMDTNSEAADVGESNVLKRKACDEPQDDKCKVSKLDSTEASNEVSKIKHSDGEAKHVDEKDTHEDNAEEVDEKDNPEDKAGNGASKIDSVDVSIEDSNTKGKLPSENNGKRKLDKLKTNNASEGKKPKWHYDNIAASELLKEKMDSLVIACKEDPLNVFNELLPFVKPSRPFLVYFSIVEPLKKLYLALKANTNVAALKLTCNWMRNYQILPERTHPDVTMNGQSGFLLSGYILK